MFHNWLSINKHFSVIGVLLLSLCLNSCYPVPPPSPERVYFQRETNYRKDNRISALEYRDPRLSSLYNDPMEIPIEIMNDILSDSTCMEVYSDEGNRGITTRVTERIVESTPATIPQEELDYIASVRSPNIPDTDMPEMETGSSHASQDAMYFDEDGAWVAFIKFETQVDVNAYNRISREHLSQGADLDALISTASMSIELEQLNALAGNLEELSQIGCTASHVGSIQPLLHVSCPPGVVDTVLAMPGIIYTQPVVDPTLTSLNGEQLREATGTEPLIDRGFDGYMRYAGYMTPREIKVAIIDQGFRGFWPDPYYSPYSASGTRFRILSKWVCTNDVGTPCDGPDANIDIDGVHGTNVISAYSYHATIPERSQIGIDVSLIPIINQGGYGLLKAINQAVSLDVDIISLSQGNFNNCLHGDAIADRISDIRQHGILTVVASNNNIDRNSNACATNSYAINDSAVLVGGMGNRYTSTVDDYSWAMLMGSDTFNDCGDIPTDPNCRYCDGGFYDYCDIGVGMLGSCARDDQCIPTDSSCDTGFVCNTFDPNWPLYRCIQYCTSDVECPPNWECDLGICARKYCYFSGWGGADINTWLGVKPMARTLVDIVTASGRDESPMSDGTYGELCCANSYATPNASAVISIFRHYHMLKLGPISRNPQVIKADILLMGDGATIDGLGYQDNEYNRRWGSGRLSLMALDAEGADAPFGFQERIILVSSGHVYDFPINTDSSGSVIPVSGDVNYINYVMLWDEPNLNPDAPEVSADIVISIIEKECDSGEIIARLGTDGSFDTKKRVTLRWAADSETRGCLYYRISTIFVPPDPDHDDRDERIVYMSAFYEDRY